MDAEGYVRITGRLKEIINRGGEKISPREVDEVLMDHPAVAQVVTFAMPHAKLGEEVGGGGRAPRGHRARASARSAISAPTRLADFKVPRKLVFLDEIPKGATGKLQRIGLAEKLGLSADARHLHLRRRRHRRDFRSPRRSSPAPGCAGRSASRVGARGVAPSSQAPIRARAGL